MILVQIKNSENRYGSIAITLHWLIAILMIGLLGLGLYMTSLPFGLQQLQLYGWHKEYGILVLMLAVVRIIWRMRNITPTLPSSMANWEKFAAHGMHYIFYAFMFAMPMTGWMMSSAAGLPVSFFGLFILPDLVSQNENLRVILVQIHEWLGYGLIAAILGHTGAALLHHFYYKDNILRRMLP